MPGTGIFIALFAGWVWGKSPMARELSNNGQLDNAWVVNAVGFLLRWVAPVLIAIVMAKGLGLF